MSVEELQKRIEELEKENKELREYKCLFRDARDKLECQYSIMCSNYKCIADFCEEDEEYYKIIHDNYYCLDCAGEICYDCTEKVEDTEDNCIITCCRCEKHYHEKCIYGGIIICAEDDGQWYCYDCDSARGATDDESEEEGEKNINEMTVKELKVLCKERGMKRYSKLKKQQLLDLLNGVEVEEEQKEEIKSIKLTAGNKKKVKGKIIELLNETIYKTTDGSFSVFTSDYFDQPGGYVKAAFSQRRSIINKINPYLNSIGLSNYVIDINKPKYSYSDDKLVETKIVKCYNWGAPERTELEKYTKEYVMVHYEINEKPFKITIEGIKFLSARETKWTSRDNTIEIKVNIQYI